MEAIAEAGLTTGIYGKMKMISFDGVKDALELVDSGKINCEVECNPLQGELLAENRDFSGGKPLFHPFCHVSPPQ